MRSIHLLCLTLLLALTLTACAEQTPPQIGEPATSSTDTGISATTDSRVSDISDTATSQTETTAIATTRSTAQSTAFTTTQTTTKKKTTTTKITTTTKKVTTTAKITTSATVEATQYENEVLRLVNVERAKQGLAALSAGSSAAMQAADVRADEIKTSFSHTRPNGSNCFTALEEAGVSYRAAGENIASGYRTPATVVEGWMNSAGHRANILNKTFTHLAVGYDNYNWVQLFYA